MPNYNANDDLVDVDEPTPQSERAYARSVSWTELEDAMDSGVIETADGCSVEPDGHCPHGYRSPLLILGLI